MSWEAIGFTFTCVSVAAGFLWWMVRVAYDVGRIRTSLEATVNQLARRQSRHGRQLAQHGRQLARHEAQLRDQEPRILSLEHFRTSGGNTTEPRT